MLEVCSHVSKQIVGNLSFLRNVLRISATPGWTGETHVEGQEFLSHEEAELVLSVYREIIASKDTTVSFFFSITVKHSVEHFIFIRSFFEEFSVVL